MNEITGSKMMSEVIANQYQGPPNQKPLNRFKIYDFNH